MLRHAQRFLLLRSVLIPFPVPDLRHVLAVFADVGLVVDELVAEGLLSVGGARAQARHPVNHVPDQMEAVEVV